MNRKVEVIMKQEKKKDDRINIAILMTIFMSVISLLLMSSGDPYTKYYPTSSVVYKEGVAAQKKRMIAIALVLATAIIVGSVRVASFMRSEHDLFDELPPIHQGKKNGKGDVQRSNFDLKGDAKWTQQRW